MKKRLSIAVLVLAIPIFYLLAWPVPIDPVSWQAPTDRGLIDPFEANDRLKFARGINIDPFTGPEDATVGVDGNIYATTSSGQVIQVRNRQVHEFSNPGGRPLGIETDRDGTLVVANAIHGLQRIDRAGNVTTLLREIGGEPAHDVNNLAIGPDGKIYFSISSSKFSAAEYRGTYDASLLDIMEHGGNGSVYSFDPGSGEVRLLLDDLNYANGVAISLDGRFLVVSETGQYRVSKYWLSGDKMGTSEVLLDNLPGFPDNLKTGANGRFWLGLVAPRNNLVDRLSDKPFLRKVVQRLPAALRPRAVPSSHVIAFDGDGVVLENLHDLDARFPTLTGVLETNRALYLTTLFGNQLPRIDKQNL